jgi:DDE superfamily endonuclease
MVRPQVHHQFKMSKLEILQEVLKDAGLTESEDELLSICIFLLEEENKKEVLKSVLLSPYNGILNEILNDVQPGERIKRRKTRTQREVPRNRGHAIEEFKHLSSTEFRSMFRLTRPAFYFLLTKIESKIESKRTLYPNLERKLPSIPAITKLAVTLRWLAGGSYLDICFGWGIAFGTFFKNDGILWGTISAINDCLKIEFPLHDPVEMERTSKGFSKYCQGRVHGTVMAVDGLVICTECPSKNVVGNQMAFRNRKGVWGIICFAGCNDKCQFTMFDVKCSGATNDSLAWKLTDFFIDTVSKGLLPRQYFLISDEAVVADEWVLSPYGGHNLGTWRDSFNYHLSAMRQCIERAFGLLVRRWGIYWRPFSFDLFKWKVVATVCASCTISV